MNFIIDKSAGELFDLFWSLYFIANEEFLLSELKRFDTEPSKEWLMIYPKLAKASNIDLNKVNFFFNRDTNIDAALLCIEEVFNTSLEKHLSMLESLTEDQVLFRLVKDQLNSGLTGDKDDRYNKAKKIVAENKVIDFIKQLDIKSSSKWDLFCFTEDIPRYIKEFTALIRSYAPAYFKEMKKYKGKLDRFYKYIESRADKDMADLLKTYTLDSYNPEQQTQIYFTAGYLCTYSLHYKVLDNASYIIAGMEYESAIEKLKGPSEVEANMIIFKNISDKTRFEIIKLLLKKDYFGLELAEELNITPATISYHMNYLMAAKLVHIERKDHKAYYSLNKDTLRRSIDFLQRELDL